MKKIQKTTGKKQTEMICNQCKKSIRLHRGFPEEGVWCAEVRWGYFSHKDGEIHRFHLCEDCYDKLIQGFAVPVEKEEATELI